MKEQTQSPGQTRSELFAKYYPQEGQGKRPMSITVHKRQMSEVFNLLKNLENFPQFFENLSKVELQGEGKANWYFRDNSPSFDSFAVPMSVEFDRNNNGMVWKAEDKAGFNYSVAIELAEAPAQRGTVVRMLVAYDNLAGEIAGKFEKLFGNDAEMISKKNLFRLKAFCETGSVPTTEGQPSGRDEDLAPELKH
jgi:uncharacterized membrane protein